MKKGLTVLALLFSQLAIAQVVFNGNGNTGFGGPVGGSSMTISHTATEINFIFTKGTGDLNQRLVIYISNGNTGRDAIGTEINDRGDNLRSAISYLDALTGKVLAFPAGFRATHAVAIETGFGGLWSIPTSGNVGNNGLTFVKSVSSTLATASQSSFTFSFNWSDVGLTSADQLSFVATYLDPIGGSFNRGFASNEGYGGGMPGTNIGQESFSFTTYLQYPSGLRGGTAPSAAAGNWTSTSTWTNGNVPLSGDAVQINHNVSVNTSDAAASSVAISTGNTLTIDNGSRLSVTGGVTGPVGSFLVNGIFRLNAGGFTNVVPIYGAGTSQLTYNTGTQYNAINEWPAASSPASIRIINSSVTLTGSRNVTGVLTIESGGSLDVNGHTLTLKASSASDYSQLLNLGTLTGNITFERTVAGSTAGWRFFSPAVSGATLDNWGTIQLSGSSNVIRLNTANPNAWVAQGGAGTDALAMGRGYGLYFGTGGVNNNTVASTIALAGSIVNTDVAISGLSAGNNTNDFGWTLVGNPYPTSMEWDNANHTKSGIADAYYVWSAASGVYASFVNGVSAPQGALSNNIPPAQGFVVKATDATPSLTFSAQARTTETQSARLRTSSQPNLIALKVQHQNNGIWDEAVLVNEPAASALYDNAFDAYKLNSFNANAINLSSLSANGSRLSINSSPNWSASTIIPLHLEHTASAAMSISADVSKWQSNGLQLVLVDNFLNTQHDLGQGAYNFVYQPGQLNRFEIRFAALTTSISTANQSKVLIYSHNETLFINGLERADEVQLTDLSGRVVYVATQPEFNSSGIRLNLPAGIYLVNLRTQQGVHTAKVKF